MLLILTTITSVEFKIQSEGCTVRPDCGIKGIVQRDVRGVESRLKQSLDNYLVAFVYFLKIKRTPLREKLETGFSIVTTIELNLPVECTIPAIDGFVHLI
jgi:hypothetical protein